jgi:hypothetical protein
MLSSIKCLTVIPFTSLVSPLHTGHTESSSAEPAEFSLLAQQDIFISLFFIFYTSKIKLLGHNIFKACPTFSIKN